MFYSNAKCQPLNMGFVEPREEFMRVGPDGKATLLSLTPTEMQNVNPVANIETDLQVLFDAGVSPEHVSTSGLFTPSDPAVMQQYATERLSKIASQVTDSVNNNTNNSTNE